ncbi:MAG TPA: MCE family protein [Marmoricola sp.]|nr:MCE family protein [Marmoricola sp.]
MSGTRIKEISRAQHEPGLVKRIFTDRLYQSMVAVLVIFVVTVAYLFAVILRAPLTEQPINMMVKMNTAAGLFEGSQVTYRGVNVGKVTRIELANPGIEVSLRLEAGTEVPKDTTAVVRSLSPVGEQYLDFQPKSKSGPFLESGSVIEASATELPETLATVVTNLNQLLSQVDTENLRSILVALATGLQGTGPALNTMIAQSQLLLNDLDELWPETDSLLTNGETALSIVPAKADSLRNLGKNAKSYAAWLKDYTPELRQNIKDAPGQINTARSLVKTADELFPTWLDRAVEVSDFFMGYQDSFRVIMTTYKAGMSALGRSVKNGSIVGVTHLLDTPRCDYGGPRRTGRDARAAWNLNGHCNPSTPNTARTDSHAPGPVPW